MKSTSLWDVTPCGPVEFQRCFRVSWYLKLRPAFLPTNFLAYSLTLKLEIVCSSETSVNLCQTTRRHIPECSDVERYFTSKPRQLALGPTQWILGLKRPEREPGHSLHLMLRLRICGATFTLPPPHFVFLAWCLIKHMDNSVIYFSHDCEIQ
jgi:hypothetical protein